MLKIMKFLIVFTFIFYFLASGSSFAFEGDQNIQNGSASNSPNFYFGTETNPLSGKYISLKDYWLTLHGHHHEGFKFELYNNDTNTTDTAFTINGLGNVGIGTTSPAERLVVNGSISKETTTGYDGTWDNFIKYGFKNDLESGTSNVNRWIGIDATITAGDAAANKMKFRVYPGSFENPLPIDVMTLQGNGNVGIGTTSPGAKLEISGTGGNQTPVLKITSTSGGSIFHWASSAIAPNLISGDHLIHIFGKAMSTRNSAHVGFRYVGDGSVSNTLSFGLYAVDDIMNINGNGNVGIGTLNPTNKLDVNGTIRAKEVKVETNWADHVFQEDYNLPTLDTVESYIKENKHLPDIPSAKEVEEEGLSMSQMMAKQMQKIEELTLYVIEQNKQITEQNNKLESQNNEIATLKKELAEMQKNMN
jgi:hypothetical protein